MKNPHLHITRQARNTAVNKLVYVAAVFYPLTTLPQIIKLFDIKSANEFSLATWIMYCLFELLFFVYAIQNKIRPLIITGILWFAMSGLMILGILLYG